MSGPGQAEGRAPTADAVAVPGRWAERALCAEADPDAWFPEQGRLECITLAKQICSRCPVRAECLDYALSGAEAGVREARLHDARHTAATTLLLLGVPERAVMDMMGWSHAAMVRRYSHVTARLRRDIADRLNAHLWEGNETRNETRPPVREAKDLDR